MNRGIRPGAGPDLGIAWVLDPIDPATFFAENWERRPLLVSGRPGDYYAGLISSADIDRLIAYTRPDVGSLLVIKDGRHFDENYYKLDRTVDLRMLYKAYDQGYTITLNGLEKRHDPIARLGRALEEDLGHAVGANAYLTPRESRGFHPHFDTHDVFVVQIEGSKRWRVYEAAAEWPGEEDQRQLDPGQLPALVLEVELRAGELLYIPRGFAHEAMTSDASSLHVTVGIFPTTWGDLLAAAVGAMAPGDPRLRRALPPGLLTGAAIDERVRSEFRELLRAVGAGSTVDGALARLSQSFRASRPQAADGHFAQLEKIARLQLGTPLRRRRGMSCRFVEGPQWAAIQFPGNYVSGPARIGPALRFVAAEERFTPGSLPGLGDNEKLVLARRLIKEGLLTITGEP